MSDIVERLRSSKDDPRTYMHWQHEIMVEAASEIESIRQQLAYTERLLAESQARNAEDGWRQCAKGQRTTQYCGQLDAAIANAKQEATMMAVGWTHALCCAALDDGTDPREIEGGEIVAKAEQQLLADELKGGEQ